MGFYIVYDCKLTASDIKFMLIIICDIILVRFLNLNIFRYFISC